MGGGRENGRKKKIKKINKNDLKHETSNLKVGISQFFVTLSPCYKAECCTIISGKSCQGYLSITSANESR